MLGREDEGKRIEGSQMIRAYCPECGEPYRVTFMTWTLYADNIMPLPLCSDCDDERTHNYAVPLRKKEIP